jgi:hypothetical protein
MDNIKQEALEHYHWMMIWAGIQDPGEVLNIYDMGLQLGEDWGGDNCIYCEVCNCNDLESNCPLDNHEECCSGLWLKMNDSETWSEWIENAWAVHQYIVENG